MSLFFVISQFKLARWGVEYSSHFPVLLIPVGDNFQPHTRSDGLFVLSWMGREKLYPARKEIAGLEGFPVSSLTDWAQDKTENVRP
jgi:hypothetical protein